MIQGCGKTEEDKGPERTAHYQPGNFRPYDSTRIIVDSVRIDLNGDGIREFVVTSQGASSETNPILQNTFDRIEVFSLDTSIGLYRSLFIDPVESGASCSFEDITRDGMPELIVETDAGGNDPVSSKGLGVYGYRSDGLFTSLFNETSGAPELRDVDADDRMEIVVNAQYWGVTTHADRILYVQSIHSFDGNAFIENNRGFAAFFDKEIARARNEYRKVASLRGYSGRDGDEALYHAFLDMALWIISRGDYYALRSTWIAEEKILASRLSADQFDDLDGLIQEVLATQRQASLENRSRIQCA